MEKAQFSHELMKYILNMDRENSVVQFSIPEKGCFILVLQEEDEPSLRAEVEANSELEKMITESQEQYQKGFGMTTS